MRRRVTIAFSLCLILMLAILAIGPSCAEPAAETPAPAPAPAPPAPAPGPAPAPPAPAPGPAPAPPAPPAPAPEVIELTINDHNPAEGPPGEAIDYWAQWVEEQSGGRLKLTVYHGGALLKGNEAFRGIETGIADAGSYALDREDGFKLNTVMSLPFMGWPDQKNTGLIYWELINKFPEIDAEWGGNMIVSTMLMPPTHIHTAKKVVVTPDDLKGLKLHCAEAQVAVSAQAAGATAVEMDIGDMPMSLDRGLIDGVVNHFPVLFVFGALEYLEQHTVFGDGGINMTPMFVIMNRDKFHSLPADLQKVIIDSRPIWHDFFLEADLGFQGFVKGQAAEMGHTFTELTPEQITAWYNLVKGPVHEKWLADYNAEGLPATAVYEEALQLIEKY